jgi:diamine N-acetyltransferase
MGMGSAMISPQFIDSTEKPNSFFNILPENWKVEITPFWEDYKNSSIIYTLEIEEMVIGGGIVFSKVSPDSQAYKRDAQQLFQRGLLYFGFLWINPEHRGNDFGSVWISELKRFHPKKKFWLSIEEEGLKKFYEKNDFKTFKEVSLPSIKEWIMVPKDFKPLQEPI